MPAGKLIINYTLGEKFQVVYEATNSVFFSNKKKCTLFKKNAISCLFLNHAVAYTIGPILKPINDCVQLYFTNGFTNILI